jgi:hypothetical protein
VTKLIIRSRVALLLFLLAISARPLVGQRVTTTLDLGAARMRYADSLDVSAMSAAPAISMDWSRARIRGDGTFAKLATQGWTTQGGVSASLFTPQRGAFLGELAGTVGSSAHSDGARTGQGIASARAYANARNSGGWLGAGLGRTWDGVRWRGVRQGELGLWAQRGNATVSGSVSPAAVDDSLRYMDSELAFHWFATRVDVDVTAGARGGERLPPMGGTARSWGGATLTLWLSAQAGLVASAGSYPVDLTQGFPGGHYASLGLRLSSPRAASFVVVPNDKALENSEASGIRVFVVETAANGQRTIRLTAPTATQVEIMGDVTSWKPVALARGATGVWSLKLAIARGTHQLNVRVNGGPWLVPPGLMPLADEFGGAAGLLVIQ